MELAYKYELKLKEKCTKGSNQNRIQINHSNQNQETTKSRKVLLRFVDKFGNTWLDKTYRFIK